LRGERDASARATHLEAATRKFLVTTNERKYMSTKTNFKRIALVAVAALGMGVLSSVPSQAAISGLTFTVTQDGTSSLALSDSTTAAKINISGIMDTNDSYTIQVVQNSVPDGSAAIKLYAYNLDSSTPTQLNAAATNQTVIDTAVATTSAQATGGAAGGDNKNRLGVAGVSLDATMAYLNDSAAVVTTTNPKWVRVVAKQAASTNYSQNFGFQLDSAVARTAGTYSYTVILKAYQANPSDVLYSTKAPDQTISKTINIVVGAATAASTVASPLYGFAFMSKTSTSKNDGIANQGDSSISVVATADGSNVGFIYVGNRNASNVSGTAVESLTAVVTGAGSVCTEGGVCGTNITVAAASDYQFLLRANGTAGVSTVTITSKVTAQTYTKSLTYFTKAAKTITATVAAPLLRVGTNDKSVRGVALDANGAQWAGDAYIVASSAADALVAGSATTPVKCTYSSSDLRHDCNVAAIAVGTAKFKIIDAATVALATATSNEITVTVTNAVVADVKISFDKATYAPNERARIYVTPVDAAGKEMQAGAYTNLFVSTGSSAGITVNGALSYTGTSTTADSFTAAHGVTTASIASSTSGAKAGSFQYTVYMPSAGGVVTLTALGGTGLAVANQGKTITASATVTDSGAAALAAVTALATTVASLKTLITTLTNLVLKIQKKVKA